MDFHDAQGLCRFGWSQVCHPLQHALEGQTQRTVGTWSIDVAGGRLVADARRRFMQWLQSLPMPLSPATLQAHARELPLAAASDYRLQLHFPIALRSGDGVVMAYEGRWLLERAAGANVLLATFGATLAQPVAGGPGEGRSALRVHARLNAAADWPDFIAFARRAVDLGLAQARCRAGIQERVDALDPLRGEAARFAPCCIDIECAGSGLAPVSFVRWAA